MRVSGILTIIPILGILSSTIAQDEVGNIGSPGEPEKEDCLKYGGQADYNAYRTGWLKFLDCSRPWLNQTELEADKAVAFSNGKWDVVTKKYCNRLPNIVPCLRNLADFVRPCLDAQEKVILESYQNITGSFLEYLCQDDGSRLASFISSGGVQCVSSNIGTIQQDCHLDAIDNQVQSAGRTYPWFEVVRKNCTVIEEFGNCTVGILQTCESSTPANIIGSVFDFFKSRKSCPVIPPTQTSPAI